MEVDKRSFSVACEPSICKGISETFDIRFHLIAQTMRPVATTILTSTGIDIDQTSEQHAQRQWGPPPTEAALDFDDPKTREKFLGCLYDGVVGSTEAESLHDRLTQADLEHLGRLADQLAVQQGISENQQALASQVSRASDAYRAFLEGKTQRIQKNDVTLANRHSLTVATAPNGDAHFYEMTNSMSPVELERLKRSTRIVCSEIENAPIIVKEGRPLKKIELGQGGFGKTRIARDIGTDTFVAVKKSHPKVGVYGPRCHVPVIRAIRPLDSLLSRLTPIQLAVLDSLRDVLVAPQAAAVIPTRASESLKSTLVSLPSMKTPADLAPLIDEMVRSKPAVRAAIRAPEARQQLLSVVRRQAPFDAASFPHTAYAYSELGVTTVEKLTEYHQFTRFCFEPTRIHWSQEFYRNGLVAAYSRRFDLIPAALCTIQQQAAYCQQKGQERYAAPGFKLKDVVYNIRFQNTLGLKMMQALSSIHENGFSHQDVKPDNIVLCMNPAGHLDVKLIDLDFLTPISSERKFPRGGCRGFMPPEAYKAEADGSVSYRPINGDSYAMGMSLRAVAGFSIKEMFKTSELQCMTTEKRKAALRRANWDMSSLLATKDNQVQNQTRVAAKMHAVPRLVMLRDIADTMMKRDPGKRLTVSEAVATRFFQIKENFLTDSEFTDHAADILRHGVAANRRHVAEINGADGSNTGYLRPLRDAGERAIRSQAAAQDSAYRQLAGESEVERAIDREESALQARAGMREAGRRIAGALERVGLIAPKDAAARENDLQQYKRDLFG